MSCLITTIALATAVLASASAQSHQLYVLNSPSNVKIGQSSVPLRATELADVVSSTFGFSVPHGEKTWSNIMMADPFSLPEAVVVLEIPGSKNPGFDLNKVDHRDLVLDEPLNEVFATVEHRMKERLANKEYSIMHGSLTNVEFLKNQVFHPNFKLNPSIKPQLIDSYDEKYAVFFNEVYHLHQLGQGVKESGLKNNVPDFHWFQLQGIKALTAVNGENSEETIDGQKVLNEAISTLVQSYNEIYNNEVLIIAITNNAKESHRNKRELSGVEMDLNVAEPISNDFPVIFNLILWFVVIFVFSLLAIALSIAQMDPGRDSIIYRMTSNRMKKEN
ncbi:ATPase H(+)-transporting accessory protein 2 [Aphis gossypii]|uniref:ATPase H(+)-transporting accessory protein 2 n=1 Tax=Aphis gossypii TaxID=80765 RepID=UPI0021595E52|nr:ATPase H(+)-transporting accessory protein 2 [Aphis gossypii]